MLRLRRGLTNVDKSSESSRIRKLLSSNWNLLDCVRAIPQIRRKINMNSTANGSSEFWSSCVSQLYSNAWNIGRTVIYCLIIIVSLVANSLIVIIVYKMPNLRKPINYFIANMATSDLLFPIFSIPLKLSLLHANSFPIDGQLG